MSNEKEKVKKPKKKKNEDEVVVNKVEGTESEPGEENDS